MSDLTQQAKTAPIGTAAQVTAANPEASVWVGANAGTGKTHVLTDRITRLLLAGAEPGRILCLTFTKAAAAEMATRLSERLGRWAVMSETALREELSSLLGKPFDGDLAQARRLFATCLEFPGGLKIQTIHAFCQGLLTRFPIEAGLAPNQRVMDDRTASELLIEARDRLLAAAGSDSDIAAAATTIAGLVNEDDFQGIIGELTSKRAQFEQLYRAHGTTAAIGEALRAGLGLKTGDREDDLIKAACNPVAVDEAALGQAVISLESGTKTDKDLASKIGSWLTDPSTREGTIFDYAGAFLVTNLTKPRAKMMTKKPAEADPASLEALEREQSRIADLFDQLRRLRMVEATEALLVMAKGLLDRYARLKQRRGLLDYDDLILSALGLLQADGGANWVLFKLDGGLDHILVDEAQDTSAEQWAVVEALASEFFAGLGQHDDDQTGKRTLFVVGDEKQSIYSFQGADPDGFARMQKHFADKLRAADGRLLDVELALSFRSTWTVVRAVDKVFAQDLARAGLTGLDRPIRHESNRDGQAGLVELWPPEEPEAVPDDSPWDLPLDRLSSKSPEARVAERIAKTIKRWLDDGEVLASRNRPVRPGDILILVQKRGRFAGRMVRALKDYDIPVSGSDRMVLTEQLAIQDLLAAAAFALLPDDDLNLAALLKSPLVGLSEDQLFTLAYQRSGSLWQSLRQKMGDDPAFQTAFDRLSVILNRADRMPPFEFFEALLTEDGGRKALQTWLGPDVADPLDEFLSLAMAFERDQSPSLQVFCHWVQAGSAIIKRDLEQGRGEVRVMTVHGSKGLQGDIVFLADACNAPSANKRDALIWDFGDEARPLVYWPVTKDNERGGAEDRRSEMTALMHKEYRRLLYVAMTRARDRLYVTGWLGKRGLQDGCWYDLIDQGLSDGLLDEVRPEGATRTTESPQTGDPDGVEKQLKDRDSLEPLPGWARERAKPEPKPSLPLSPSKPEDEPPGVGPFDPADPSRFKRGQLIHKLLQHLPDIDLDQRRAAGLRLLHSHGVSDDDAQAWIAETERVLTDPDFAEVFGPGSLAEVPIIGLLDDQVVSARIDRLLITDQKVLIVDFKTNRPAPKNLADVPDVYHRQMAVYGRLIAGLYPDRPIQLALLWTDRPRLMALNSNDGLG